MIKFVLDGCYLSSYSMMLCLGDELFLLISKAYALSFPVSFIHVSGFKTISVSTFELSIIRELYSTLFKTIKSRARLCLLLRLTQMEVRRAINQRSTVILSSVLTMAHAKIKLYMMTMVCTKNNGHQFLSCKNVEKQQTSMISIQR